VKRGPRDPGGDAETAERPAAVILSYKRVKGHPRIERMATTLADGGRDVLILGLADAQQEERYALGPHVRGVGIPRFVFRRFVLRQALRPLNLLERWVEKLRWTR
jgi:hypothetical protein